MNEIYVYLFATSKEFIYCFTSYTYKKEKTQTLGTIDANPLHGAA